MWTRFREQTSAAGGQDSEHKPPKHRPDITVQHDALRWGTFYSIFVVAAVFQIIQSIRAA
jgi:hypothetical protein